MTIGSAPSDLKVQPTFELAEVWRQGWHVADLTAVMSAWHF